MKKALLATFCIAALFVLITIMCPIKENPIIETTTVSVQQEIVYAYVTTEMLTNNYGGVHGHQDYICYGVQDGTYYDRYAGAALYLTDTMLKNLRASN